MNMSMTNYIEDPVLVGCSIGLRFLLFSKPIKLIKLLSSDVALYLYKFTIRPCMEYDRHV